MRTTDRTGRPGRQAGTLGGAPAAQEVLTLSAHDVHVVRAALASWQTLADLAESPALRYVLDAAVAAVREACFSGPRGS